MTRLAARADLTVRDLAAMLDRDELQRGVDLRPFWSNALVLHQKVECTSGLALIRGMVRRATKDVFTERSQERLLSLLRHVNKWRNLYLGPAAVVPQQQCTDLIKMCTDLS